MPRGDTRQRILDATLRLVAAQGFAATPVTAIESEAGLIPGNGSFYRHFPTKEDALAEAVDQEIARIRPDPLLDDLPLRDRLGRDLAFLSQLRPLIRILARDRDEVPKVVASIGQTLLDSGLLGYAALLPDTPPHEAPALGAVILTALVGYHLSTDYFGGPPGGIGPDDFTSALADLFHSPATSHAPGK